MDELRAFLAGEGERSDAEANGWRQKPRQRNRARVSEGDSDAGAAERASSGDPAQALKLDGKALAGTRVTARAKNLGLATLNCARAQARRAD